MKKLLTLALCLMLLFGLLNAAAVADVMENIRISNILYYPSGYLKGFTMSYEIGTDRPYAPAPIRVSVQTEQFRKTTSANPTYGDFTNLGEYAKLHPQYTTWPDRPEDCGFIAWTGDTFQRPGTGVKPKDLEIRFADNRIDGNQNNTYYMYAWANYRGRTYPDAYVTLFTTNNGTISGAAIEAGKVPPDAAQDVPAAENMPQTGDNSQLILWIALSLLAGAGLLLLMRRRASDR